MKVLYYSHHHGSGHARNAAYFHSILKENIYIATSSDYAFESNVKVYRIPDEHQTKNDLTDGRQFLPSYLHYSPLGNKNILNRSFEILKICKEEEINFAIVDVSVEIGTLLRVASIPFAYVRLPGNREDYAHLNCYKAAIFLLAYYPKELEDSKTPQWVVDKTIYLDFLINLKQVKNSFNEIPGFLRNNTEKVNLIIKGYGGHETVDKSIYKLREKLNGIYISIGPIDNQYVKYYDYIIDYYPDVPYLMSLADRIIIPPSMNLTAEALSSKKAITLIPCWRHFDEHYVMASNLVRCGYADTLDNIREDHEKYEGSNYAEGFLKIIKNATSVESLTKTLNISIQ